MYMWREKEKKRKKQEKDARNFYRQNAVEWLCKPGGNIEPRLL